MLLGFSYILLAAYLTGSTLTIALPDNPAPAPAPAPAAAAAAPALAPANAYKPSCAAVDPNVPFAGWDLAVRPYCEESYAYFYHEGIEMYTAYKRDRKDGDYQSIPAPTYYSYSPCAFTFKLYDGTIEDNMSTDDAVRGAIEIANGCHYFGSIQISESIYVELNDSVIALKDAAANGDPVFPFQYQDRGGIDTSPKPPNLS